MASSLAATSALTKPATLVHYNGNIYKHSSLSKVYFRQPPPKPKLRIFTKGLHPSPNSTVVKAQYNKISVDGTSKAADDPSTKLGIPITEAKDSKSSKESPKLLATEESVSDFMVQVASLVKLVDSRDIVELQLKQHDMEVVIRKKEALPQPPAPVAPISLPPPPVYTPSSSPVPAPLPAQASAPAPSAPAAKSAKSSVPPLKSPMAGTFYRSPGPSEPPFVKVGDKVQKGQVLCIIEAMKLMNEIESDQAGTIVEVLMEDGKPVSIDTPLFAIQH